jgi:hypothetical protein
MRVVRASRSVLVAVTAAVFAIAMPAVAHAASCSDSSATTGTVYGTFITPSSNTTANTSILVLPDTADAESYVAQTLQNAARQQQISSALSAMQNGSTNAAAASPPPMAASSTMTAQSQLLQRLQDSMRGTAPNTITGLWSCAGLTTGPYIILATVHVVETVTNPNPSPLPVPSGLDAQTQSLIASGAGKSTKITTYYFTSSAYIQQQDIHQVLQLLVLIKWSDWTLRATSVVQTH